MQITITKLKVAASLSEETTAYTAVVCVNGKPAFHASNHGTGGCDFYHPVAGYTGPSEAEISAWLGANMPKISGAEYGVDDMDCTLEIFIGDLIAKDQREKRLARMLKSKLVIIDMHKGAPALFTLKHLPTDENIARWKAMAAKGGKGELVNGNAEAIERALALV